MSDRVPNFRTFVNEEVDQDREALIDAGLVNRPLRERVELLENRWGSDPAISKAWTALIEASDRLIDSMIKPEDWEDPNLVNYKMECGQRCVGEGDLFKFIFATGFSAKDVTP